MAQKLKRFDIVGKYSDEETMYEFRSDGECYDADEVDAVLAEKDKNIAELKTKLEDVQASTNAEIRRLKRALWNARVHALRRFSVLAYNQMLSLKGKKSKVDFSEMCDKIDAARLKCKAKAKEYK